MKRAKIVVEEVKEPVVITLQKGVDYHVVKETYYAKRG